MSDIRIGIAGLGAASTLVLPYLAQVPGVRLAGAADIRPEAREAFTQAHGLPAFAEVRDLCRSPDIDAVWIETPNHLHCEHALLAAAHGKHAICAKPIATTLADCDRMIAAANEAGTLLIQGHSKVFDPPIRAMREMVASGRLGAVTQANIWLFNDWLQRPRLAMELDPAQGGGLVLRQAPHLVDICNYIVGRPARGVRAMTGAWDAAFAGESHVQAAIMYEGGATAAFTIDGTGYFDITELTWGIDGLGRQRDGRAHGSRARRAGPLTEDEKYGKAFREAPPEARRQGEKQPFFGMTVVSCERGAIRQSPDGLFVYDEAGRHEIVVPPYLGRAAELIELRDALAQRRPAFPDGVWGKATLETCLAIRQSAAQARDVPLLHQVVSPLAS